MEQVKDNSSSLMCLLDSTSYHSSWSASTDRASLWSRTFAFDGDLLGSNVYKGQFRVLMKWYTRKRAKPHRIGIVANTNSDLEKGARRQNQVTGDVLLLGPEIFPRMQLLYNLQLVFHPARNGSIFRAYKDEIIRYDLPFVCGALRDAYSDAEGDLVWAKIRDDKRTQALFDRLYDQRDVISPVDWSRKWIVDALAKTWKNKTTRQALLKKLTQKSPTV